MSDLVEGYLGKTEEGRKEIEGAIVELIDFAYSKKK